MAQLSSATYAGKLGEVRIDLSLTGPYTLETTFFSADAVLGDEGFGETIDGIDVHDEDDARVAAEAVLAQIEDVDPLHPSQREKIEEIACCFRAIAGIE